MTMPRTPSDQKPTFISLKFETVIQLLLLAALAVALWKIGSTLVVIATAIVVAAFVEGTAGPFMKRLSLPRPASVVIVYVTLFALFGGALYLILPTFIQEISGLLTLLPEGSGLTEIIGTLGNGATPVGDDPVAIADHIRETYQSLSGNVFQIAGSLFGGVVNVVLIMVISFYLSMQDRGIEQFLRLITPVQHESYVVDVWHRTQKKIGYWFQGQMVMALIVAILTYIGLTIVGSPYALVLSLTAGVFELVPFGLLLAVVPALVIAFQAGGWTLLLWVAIIYIVIQQFENYVLQPLIIQRATGIPSLVILLSIIIGVNLFGIYGLFLGIPVAVLAVELINDKEAKKLASMQQSK
jgi:predicted PurR-regulated permease PerM